MSSMTPAGINLGNLNDLLDTARAFGYQGSISENSLIIKNAKERPEMVFKISTLATVEELNDLSLAMFDIGMFSSSNSFTNLTRDDLDILKTFLDKAQNIFQDIMMRPVT